MDETIRTTERARKLVAAHLGIEQERVVDLALFRQDLGADSLDVVELTMATEEEFGVEMNDDDADRVFGRGSFGDLTRWLRDQRVAA
jgi:acyl carrier protein